MNHFIHSSVVTLVIVGSAGGGGFAVGGANDIRGLAVAGPRDPADCVPEAADVLPPRSPWRS